MRLRSLSALDILDRSFPKTWLALSMTFALTVGCGSAGSEPPDELERLVQEIRARFPSVSVISTGKLAVMVERSMEERPWLLDVRAPEEYAVSHLPGAIRVATPEDAIEQLGEGQPARAVVVYCSVGYRSADFAARLQSRGLTNVFNLEGSIFEWANEGRPVYRGTTPVRVVHPFDRKWGRLLRRELWSFGDETTAPVSGP
jgi:rhodanese-related sulfurtransferase